MVLPFLEVLHLPSSSSFYSAVLQPLGLYYSHNSSHQAAGGSFVEAIGYGATTSLPSGSAGPSSASNKLVLQIRQTRSPLGPLRLSSVTLAAPSPTAVAAFHACSLRANPALLSSRDRTDHESASFPDPRPGSLSYSPDKYQQGLFGVSERPAVIESQRARRLSTATAPTHHYASPFGEVVSPSQTHHRRGLRQGRNIAWLGTDKNGDVCCVTHDLDGNRLLVIYSDSCAPPYTYSDNPFVVAKSPWLTGDSPAQVLDWDFDDTTATKPSRAVTSILSSSAPAPNPFLPNMSRQTSVAPSPAASPFDSNPSKQSSSTGGLNATTVVGAILGVAAGAAFTYGALTRDKQPEPRHVAGPREPMPPTLSRRSTYHEPERRSHYGDRRLMIEEMTPRKYKDDYPSRRITYADVVDDYEHAWPPPRYLTEGGHRSAVPTAPSVSNSMARSRAIDEEYDRPFRAPSRHHSSRSGVGRSRSEAPRDREAFAPMEPEIRSKAQSRHTEIISRHHEAPSQYPEAPPRYTEGPKSAYTHARSHLSSYDPDRESYFSARTHRTRGTARPSPAESRPPVVEYDIQYRSKPRSRASSTTRGPTPGGHHRARSSSRGPSRVSAREIPLPMSGVGSSQANWDDDLESVAPSDSISCVGSKSSRRSRRHR